MPESRGQQERLDPQVPQGPRESLEQAYLLEVLPVRFSPKKASVTMTQSGLILRPVGAAVRLVRRLRFRSAELPPESRDLTLR